MLNTTGKVAPLDHKTLLIPSSYVVAERVFRVVNVWCAFSEQNDGELKSRCTQQKNRVSSPKIRLRRDHNCFAYSIGQLLLKFTVCIFMKLLTSDCSTKTIKEWMKGGYA